MTPEHEAMMSEDEVEALGRALARIPQCRTQTITGGVTLAPMVDQEARARIATLEAKLKQAQERIAILEAAQWKPLPMDHPVRNTPGWIRCE